MREDKMLVDNDSFWDLSDSVSPKKTYPTPINHVEPVTLDVTPGDSCLASVPSEALRLSSVASEDTVIHRVVTPNVGKTEKEAFDDCEEYSLSESPIHRVSLKKWKCSYHFYDEFLQDALRWKDVVGQPSPYVSFFSYVPQYNQLSERQLAFYLGWREACRHGEFPKTDYSYLLLYVFELINLGERVDTVESQRMLTELWKHYRSDFPAIEARLSRWICDYSLIHRLPPPENADSAMVRHESVLKEFFITLPKNDPMRCVRSLLKYCCSYDYRSSKFAVGENLPLYDLHVFGVLAYVLTHFRGGDGFLADFSGGDSHMTRNAYEGALCCAAERYRIELDYCSFSRTNELRFLIGDMVKYAENKIRSHIGVKSKLSVYSITGELRACMDAYFLQNLSATVPKRKKEAPQEYDILYDLPRKPFSLAEAKEIEKNSWDVTRALVSAFEEENSPTDIEPPTEELPMSAETVEQPPEATEGFAALLGEWYAFALAVKRGDVVGMEREEMRLGQMRDWIVDRINEIAVEYMGDILIEDNGDGYAIPEDYEDML